MNKLWPFFEGSGEVKQTLANMEIKELEKDIFKISLISMKTL